MGDKILTRCGFYITFMVVYNLRLEVTDGSPTIGRGPIDGRCV